MILVDENRYVVSISSGQVSNETKIVVKLGFIRRNIRSNKNIVISSAEQSLFRETFKKLKYGTSVCGIL